MPSDVKAFDLLISCPSDVSDYVDVLEKEVYRFNNTFGRANNLILRPRHFSNDVYSDFGDQPQSKINQQIVDSSDMVVGVFWTRFGTPTENYGSGTEEELERMLSNNKKVFLYFLNKPIAPDSINYSQLGKVKRFKEKNKNRSIYFTVNDEVSLAKRFTQDLELYFFEKIRSEELEKIGDEKNSKKEILWVDDKPENNVYERNILEGYGIGVTLALSTQQALDCMKHHVFSLIISDMGRKEGAQEGYVLLDTLRSTGNTTPLIFYAGSKRREHIEETLRRGGQGCTNDPMELIDMVIKCIVINQ